MLIRHSWGMKGRMKRVRFCSLGEEVLTLDTINRALLLFHSTRPKSAYAFDET